MPKFTFRTQAISRKRRKILKTHLSWDLGRIWKGNSGWKNILIIVNIMKTFITHSLHDHPEEILKSSLRNCHAI